MLVLARYGWYWVLTGPGCPWLVLAGPGLARAGPGVLAWVSREASGIQPELKSVFTARSQPSGI